MDKNVSPVQIHHQAAAAVWARGGRHYDDISFAISDALAHAAQRLDARAGEKILDVATGTGWSARNAARTGAIATGVDIAEELLEAARKLSAHSHPAIEFRRADAECLPFRDAEFDAIISTFGVMFALDQPRAAAELARVCRPGGRLVLATWSPDGAVAEFFALIGKHSGGTAPPTSPLAWGDRAHVETLLAPAFELAFEAGCSNAYHADTEAIWEWYVRGFGPLRVLAETLPPAPLAELKAEIDAYHLRHATPSGLHLRREYLLTIGRRR